MARFQVRDLTKVKQAEPLNLKTEDAQSAASGTHAASLAPRHHSPINLKKHRPEQNQIWNNRSSKHLDSLSANHKSTVYNLVPRTQLTQAPVSRFHSVLRIAVSGVLIVFIINIFNVFANSKNFQSVLVSSAASGYQNLMSGVEKAKKQNTTQAEADFQNAQDNFNGALEKISFLKTASTFSKQENVSALENLLKAGKSISEAGQLFSESAGHLQDWPTLFIQANQNLPINAKPTTKQSQNGPDSTPKTAPSLTDRLKLDLTNVQTAIAKISEAKTYLDQVQSSSLPSEYGDQLPAIKARLDHLQLLLSGLSEHFPAILSLLGDRYPHRYLVLLQNDTEARPTGGFIGSLMILDINEGVVTRADFHDVYQYDGQLTEKIDAPEDIASITQNWRLRDSNYSPDFALSAEKAAWFLQKSKGPSVDTVIAVNQSIIADVLGQLGPIEVAPLKDKLTAENFQFMVSYLVESKYFGADNPKKILEKILNAFKDKLLAQKDFHDFFGLMLQEIHNQKIMFYSRDEQVQSFFEFLHLTPHQAAIGPRDDYAQVIATSIGGNKSDLYMTENLDHQTFISADGTIHDELTITRRHNWTGAELLRWQKILQNFGFENMSEGLLDIEGRGVNKASLKVYVPFGAELQNTVGLDQSTVQTRSDSDLQKTYFLFPMTVAPGQEQTVILRYQLPFKLKLLPADIYHFYAQSQPGLVPTILRHQNNLDPQLTQMKTAGNLNEVPATLTEKTLQGQLKTSADYSAVIAN